MIMSNKCPLEYAAPPPPHFVSHFRKNKGYIRTTYFYWHSITNFLSFNYCRIRKGEYFLFYWITSTYFYLVNAINFPGPTRPFSSLWVPVISMIVKLSGCVWRKWMIMNKHPTVIKCPIFNKTVFLFSQKFEQAPGHLSEEIWYK